ncbi:MAG: hypothetical protein L6R37_006872 [Teloschistes peruensis]|nr:MAG: hypothetical protein L6R37_006872 [Teloschistes peruensis]
MLVQAKKKYESMTEQVKWLQEERTRHESSPGASPDTNYKGLHTLYRKLLAERDWYKSRNTDLNNQKAKLEHEKETLARERGTNRTLNSNYQTQIQNLKTEIADLGSQKETLQGNCDELKRDAEGLSKEKTQLESRRNELSSEVKDLQAQKGRLWKTFKANTQGRMSNQGPTKREWTEDNSNQEPRNEASTEAPKEEGTGKDGSKKEEGPAEERTIKKKRTEIS